MQEIHIDVSLVNIELSEIDTEQDTMKILVFRQAKISGFDDIEIADVGKFRTEMHHILDRTIDTIINQKPTST